MSGEPLLHLWVFVRSVVVENQVDRQAGVSRRVNLFQEADELLVPVPRLAVSNHLTRRNVQCGKQRCRAVPLVVVGLPFGQARRRGRMGCVRSSA